LRVFGNRILKRIFEPKREKVAGGWRRLHNEDLCNLYTVLNIKSRKRQAGHVACMEARRNAILWLENLKSRDHLEDLGIDRKII